MTEAEKERRDIIAYLRYLDRNDPPQRSWLNETGEGYRFSKQAAIIRDIQDGLHKKEAYQL